MSLEYTTKSLFNKLSRSPAVLLSSAAFVFATAATQSVLANPVDRTRAESSLSVRERQARDAGRRSLQENNLLTLHGNSSQDGFTDFYVHSATALPEKIVLSNGTYHMPIGLGSGDYKQSWRFSKYAAFCEALEKRDQNKCGAFVVYNVKHNSVRGVKGQANSVELDPARILVLHREVVDEGQGKMASQPTTKNDPSLGIWDVLYDVTQNRNDKNGRDASAFLSNKDEYFSLKTNIGERKFAHVYFHKNDELVVFLGDYTSAFNKTRPQPASVPTPPAPSVPPVHVPPVVPPAQVPVPPAPTVSPTAVPPPVPLAPDPRPLKKEDFLRPVESLTVGFAQTRADYHDGDDVVSLKDSALEAAVNFQMRKPQWSAFMRMRISGSVPLSGHIGYQNKTIGEYRRFKGAGDITAAIPFGKGHTVEVGPYVSQTTRYVEFNFGEVQREEETLNYGGLLRGNFEVLKAGEFHFDLRALLGIGWQNESARGSDIKIEFTTLDSFFSVPVIYSTAKNCELENSEHSEDHRCYWFSVMPYFGSRKYIAHTGNADPNRTVDSTRLFLGVDADVRVYGPLLWMVNFQHSEETYPRGNNGPPHAVWEDRWMTGPRFQF